MSHESGARLLAADIARARSDPVERSRLIERYTPFVLRVATQAVGRYVRLGEDDEVSIAMIAFDEAIDRYDPRRGTSFLALAETVIRRRLVDHYRRTRPGREIPFSALEGDDEGAQAAFPGEDAAARDQYRREREGQERREEIERYRLELARYGLDFRQLLRGAPRHRDAREGALRVAHLIARTPEFALFLRERGNLPLRSLEGATGVPRKTLERHRRYIVAVALALLGDYPYLQGYLVR